MPPCCCKQCTDGFVPQCTDFTTSSQCTLQTCGCICTGGALQGLPGLHYGCVWSGPLPAASTCRSYHWPLLFIIVAVKCNENTANEICCAKTTDHCYNKDGNTANGDEACCPDGECPLDCRG